MEKIKYLLLLGFMCGCAPHSQINSDISPLCYNSQTKLITFNKLKVLLYSTQHGDYLKIEKCPERNFAVDFSNSGLYNQSNAKLLEKIRYRSIHENKPTVMIISGHYQVFSENGVVTSKIIVSSINSYDLNK